MSTDMSASGKPNRGSVDVAGTLVLVSTEALWRQPRKPSQVVALQPDDRETDRWDVRPQQPCGGLSHHICLVIIPGIGEHRDLLDEWLSPCRVSINVPIAGLPLWSRRKHAVNLASLRVYLDHAWDVNLQSLRAEMPTMLAIESPTAITHDPPALPVFSSV